jgi:aerobic carbon-monoxide dehydrogenase large subunit
VVEPASPRLFGASVKRIEDPRLLCGEGRYLADLTRPGLLHAAFLRSPHAHARIARIDASRARAEPGVLLVLDGAEAIEQARPFRVPMRAEQFCETTFPHLACQKVRFVGEPVALVVAEDPYRALDALELIEVEYEPLPAVADVEAALAPGAPLLHDDASNNVLFERHHESGDVAAAFAAAEVVIRETFRNGRNAGLPLENRGVLAEPEPESGRLRVWSSTQVPFTVRTALAASLGLDESAITVATPDIGGGFGVKAVVYAEEMLVPLTAKLLGRPVRWAGDRQEDLLATNHARNQVIQAELAARRDGTILALRADVLCDVGAYGVYPYGPALEALGTPGMLPGPYRLENYAFRTRAVATNKAPGGPYRGVGMVIAAIVHERLVDLLAGELGMDPAEVRRRNFIPSTAFPYRTASGMPYDSGSFAESLEVALEAADYAALRRQQAEARQAGRLLGIGIGSYVEFTGIGGAVFQGRGMVLVDGREGVDLAVRPDGRVRAVVSHPSIGQGSATTFAQLIADELGLPLEQVVVEQPDTDRAPFGSGTFASRGAVIGGTAIRQGCDELKERALDLASGLLEVSGDDLVFERGGVAVRGAPERRVTLAELAARSDGDGQTLLSVRQEFDPPMTTFANATHLALVEVDPESGLVTILRYIVAEDCGKLINPMIVDGQVHGAVAQGIGGALYEELHYDQAGQLLSGSLLDYVVPGAFEMPTIEIHHLESPAPHSILGVKGIGEGGTIGAPPTIANAVADALNARVTDLPLSPDRVRQLARSTRASLGTR